MKKRILSLLLALSTALTAVSIISLPVYANSNLTMGEIKTLVESYFCDNSGLDGNFVIFDSETTETNNEYLFFVRYQGNSYANTLHAMAAVNKNTGEMFIDDEYVCNLLSASAVQNDEYKNILNGNFSLIAGNYKNAYGEKIVLYENGLDEWRVTNNYFEYKIENIWEDDGSYQWLIVPYDPYDKDVAFEGYRMIIYPKNIEVKTISGEIVQSDTSKVRLWCGNGDVYDNQYIYYKQDDTLSNEIDALLNGDFSEFSGTYKYNSGHSFELLASGLSNLDISDEGTEFRVEDITKETDGTYTWSTNCYIDGECFDGVMCILYPKGVEVVSYEGRILPTDTSKVRFWSGNAEVSDVQYIAYKQGETVDEVKVVLNGEEIEFDQPPVMINDRVMVPIRAIFETMGYTVNWNGETQTAEAIKLNNNITVQINNNIIRYAVNEKSGIYECDVVPQIISGRTLVPVRAIAESAGCDVQWDGENTTVIITYYENSSNQLAERNVKALLLAGYDDNEDTKLQKNHLSANRLSVDYVERALNILNVYNIEKYYMENDNNYMSASELSTLLSLTFKETTDNDLSIIYYSGHSFYYFDEYDNEKHITAFSNYTFQDFYNIIRENVKGDVLLMYDGCYAGKLMNLDDYDDRIKIIAACDEDDYSSSYYLSEIDTTSDENQICSIFAYALYNGAINNINYLDLNNDKTVAFDELYVYLLNSVYNICDRITTQEDKLNRLKDMLGLDSALRIAQIVQSYPNSDTTPLFKIK